MVAFLDWLDGLFYYPILVVVLSLAGIWFTVKTKGVNFTMIGEAVRVLKEKPEEEGAISSFKALMVSTASRVGTGNIVGVSTAVVIGGFGSVFWMWVIAFIGMASAFVESTLAQIYKRKDKNGGSYGGPAYYIEDALHSRTFGVVFAVFLILTYAGGFNMLASYNLQSAFAAFDFYVEGKTCWIIGAILAISVGYCIFGGGKRIASVTGVLVPFMGVLYIAVALIVVLTHASLIPSMFKEIFANAFDFQSAAGGFAGSCMIYGFKRGLFSNEAGVGSAPNAAASASVSHPVKQGLIQMFSVFLDTIVLCTCTAFMCMCCGIAPTEELAGVGMVQAATGTVLGTTGGAVFVAVALALFAFTTLLGNFFYVDNNLAFINNRVMPGDKFMKVFRVIAAIVIFLGAGLSMTAAWAIADILMALMCLVNIPACMLLGKVAYKALDDYKKQRAEGKNPVFRAADIGLDESEVDYWK